jgi:hypothetical protein
MHGRTGALTQTEALQNQTLFSLTTKQKYKLFEQTAYLGTNQITERTTTPHILSIR